MWKSVFGGAKDLGKAAWKNGMIKRAGQGAAFGGAAGLIGSGGNTDGMWAGAAMGAAGGAAMSKWGGGALKGMRSGYSEHVPGLMGKINSNKFLSNQGFGGTLGGVMNKSLVGGGDLLANKNAGKYLFGMGAASAGLIGNSMMNSNRGY